MASASVVDGTELQTQVMQSDGTESTDIPDALNDGDFIVPNTVDTSSHEEIISSSVTAEPVVTSEPAETKEHTMTIDEDGYIYFDENEDGTFSFSKNDEEKTVTLRSYEGSAEELVIPALAMLV